ncbi:MAG: hypothetical protein HY316_03420 [Acidobacteria bacterium]|nr:hypothetical protein [Acidobacteriota bacterium]
MMKSRSVRISVEAVFLVLLLLSSAAVSAAPPQRSSNQDFSIGLTAQVDASGTTIVTIPGPLKSFQRIAAISQKAAPEEILGFLARNVVVDGYHHGQDRDRKPTEFLKLLDAYLDQARELQALADSQERIRVEDCNGTGPLLRILGYRLRDECGPNASVETADPERAFLTVDSGFPLVQLEEDLQQGKPFEYPFAPSTVPVMFTPKDWAWTDNNVVDTLLEDPLLARLYWAFSRLDEEAANLLRQSPGLRELVPLAPILDFYGGHLAVRSGKVLVPGGTAGEAAWKDLVGVSPDSPSEFLVRLLKKDEGWLAAYFDALWYVPRSQQNYFADPNRLKRFYEALRGKDLNPSPARSVFRPTANLYLLTSRLLIDRGGKPHVPGNLEIWKEIFRRKSENRTVRDWAKRSGDWRQPEQLLEAMMSLSRVPSEDGPLQVYLQLMEVDRRRSPEHRLSPALVREMADKYSRYRDQYLIFTEFSELDDNAVSRFLAIAGAIDAIRNDAVQANALGLFQANLGLWQILARQGQIPRANWNSSWQKALQPFAAIKTSAELYDASRASLSEVWQATGATTPITQDAIIQKLAGPAQTDREGQEVHEQMADRIRSVMDSQRLVSLSTLLQLGNGLTEMSQGKAISDSLIRMAAALREFEMPLPIFTNRERSEWASGLQHNPHTSLQTRTDLSKVISNSKSSPSDVADARGALTPFLRDTLVGLNYAYYEPPGAQMVRNNPLFVRSHNFSGQMTMKGNEVWQTPRVFGRGWTASGGAHLAGSISDLPYVLSQVEQDFIVPENVQSLIWADLVPTILTSAVLPRWWNVTENEMRAVALYQQLGEELVSRAAEQEALRTIVMDHLSAYMLPRRSGRFEKELQSASANAAVAMLMPSELFFLGEAYFNEDPAGAEASTEAGRQLNTLRRETPEEVSLERISTDFGVPHPMLAQTYARELIAMKPLPTFLGYSSRLMAESWESSNLYWARLAAEQNYHPATLHNLVPQLTHRMVEKIFATHLEDWPAVLRALRETGEEFKLGNLAAGAKPAAGTGL